MQPDDRDLATDATFRNLMVLRLETLLKEGHRGLLGGGAALVQELATKLSITTQTSETRRSGRAKPLLTKNSPEVGSETSVLWAILAE